MTFKLKGYNELKAHFKETVGIILRKYEVESIEELEEPRLSQIKFINYTIEHFDKKLSTGSRQEKLDKYAEASRTLNGAMFLVSTQITESLGKLQRKSLLRDRLDLAMGITAENQPTPFDLNKCQEELNKFFNLIFNNEDSRQGLNPKNDLQYIPLDVLIGLMKRSYELEEQSHKAEIATFAAGAQTVVQATNFSTKPIPPELIAPFTDWPSLQAELQQLKSAELADKNEADVDFLSKERASQFLFLKAVNESFIPPKGVVIKDTQEVQAHKNDIKVVVLAGAMCLVREQIGREYSLPPLFPNDIPESIFQYGSVTHRGLTQTLKSNSISPENVEALMHMLNDYIMFMTTEPKKHREEHLFSKIKDFSLPGVVDLILSTITVCRKMALDRAVDTYKLVLAKAEQERLAKEKPTEPESVGIAGALKVMLWGTPKPKEEKPKAETTEEKTATTSTAP